MTWPCYSEDLPTAAGCYVYRLRDAEDWCLYVGMVGDNGPRRLSARLAEHRRTKKWWPFVARIDAADCESYGDAVSEEVRQIKAFQPYCNIQVHH